MSRTRSTTPAGAAKSGAAPQAAAAKPAVAPPPARRGARRAPKPQEDRHFVTALARGLQVLACFQPGDRGLGNLEIAQRCGLPKSTVSRLTATLTKLNYLTQAEDNGRYGLGTATLALGSAVLSRMDVRQVARPLMQQLANDTRCTVSLGVRDRLSMIYVENCRSSAPLTLSMEVGSRIPLVSSAIGRAWLALAGEREWREIAEQMQDLDSTAWPPLRRGIEQARQDHATLGVACSFGDWQRDVHGIARAFQPGGGLPPMAINCGGAASSLPREYLLDEVRPRLIAVVAQIEAAMAR